MQGKRSIPVVYNIKTPRTHALQTDALVAVLDFANFEFFGSHINPLTIKIKRRRVVSKMLLLRAKNIALLFAFSLTVLYTSCDTIADAFVLPSQTPKTTSNGAKKTNTSLWPTLVVAAAFFTLPVVDPAFATSETAAQIQLNSIPPSTVQLQIGDLPLIGNLISGTYARIDPGAAVAVGRALGGDGEYTPKAASVTITSPLDKVAAIKDLATTGHLEFGKFFLRFSEDCQLWCRCR